MVFRNRRSPSALNGYEAPGHYEVAGYGDHSLVIVRDEFGKRWRGTAHRQENGTTRFFFTDADGKRVSGIADGFGILLSDDQGKTWRGRIY